MCTGEKASTLQENVTCKTHKTNLETVVLLRFQRRNIVTSLKEARDFHPPMLYKQMRKPPQWPQKIVQNVTVSTIRTGRHAVLSFKPF